MKVKIFVVIVLSIQCLWAVAAPGDTTIVQTFSFDRGRNANKVDTFRFPDGTKQYSKVLMYYTVKCDMASGGSYPCGEWDMIVYTDILKPKGKDSNGNTVFETWRLLPYITPYGGRLHTGIPILKTDGWRYVYDVTDFLPLLKNDVVLRDGNYQELVDIKFVFIEGTPVREVINIKPVWSNIGKGFVNDWNGIPLSKFDSVVRDTTFVLASNEKQVKLRTTVTGHNFGKGRNCAEFCSNIHKIEVNGKLLSKWDIIQSCSDVPMYPQGGTWVYARAGWCPGLEGKTREFELTPYIENNSITCDYDIDSDPYGVYCITSYLVTYGDIKQDYDVEALAVMAPTIDPNQGRFNPSAFSPVVVIKNIGKKPLTSANILYGFEGHEVLEQSWSGRLEFLQTDTIILKYIPNWNKVAGDKTNFYFEVVNPNGVADPTPYNNKAITVCRKPLIFNNNELLVNFTTNKIPKDTYWQLTDIDGKVLYGVSTDTLKASKNYITNMVLKNGTYCLSVYDRTGDGLGWWANTAAGDGRLLLQYIDSTTNTTKTLHRFNVDFGSFFNLWFAVNEFSTNVTDIDNQLDNVCLYVYPNPADDVINIDLSTIKSEDIRIEIRNVLGYKCIEQVLINKQINQVDIKSLNQGVYLFFLHNGKHSISKGKFIVGR